MKNKAWHGETAGPEQQRGTHPEELLIAALMDTAERTFPHGLPHTFDVFAGELSKKRTDVAGDLTASVGSECAAAYTHLSDTAKRRLWMSVWLASAAV